MDSKALRAAGLIGTGFIGGIVGVSAYSGLSLADLASPQHLAEARASDACVPDANASEDPIYFLSCGGIY